MTTLNESSSPGSESERETSRFNKNRRRSKRGKFQCIVSDCENDAVPPYFSCDWHKAKADAKIAVLEIQTHNPAVKVAPYEWSCVECGQMGWRWWTVAQLKQASLAKLKCFRCGSNMIEVVKFDAA